MAALSCEHPIQRTSAFVAMTCIGPASVPTIDSIKCIEHGDDRATNHKEELS